MSVLDILRGSDLGTLQQLPNTLCADYIWVPNGQDDMCIPFKHAIETAAGSWNFYARNYMYILEFLDQKAVVLLPKDKHFYTVSTRAKKAAHRSTIGHATTASTPKQRTSRNL